MSIYNLKVVGNGSIENAINRKNYLSKTSNYTVTADDSGSFLDCLSGTFTISFPSCAYLKSGWEITIRNNGTGYITLNPNGNETINSQLTVILGPSSSTSLTCTGTEFRIGTIVTDLLALPILSTAASLETPLSSGETLYTSTKAYSSGGPQLSYANGVFFAGSFGSTQTQSSIATSTDGTNWTTRTLPTLSVSGYGYAEYGSGLFVALGSQNGTSAELATATSISGTWTARSAAGFSSSFFRGLMSNGSTFFGYNQSAGQHVYSADGITWTLQSTPAIGLYSGAYHRAVNLYMTFPGLSTTYYTSPDGTTWTSRTAPAAIGFQPGCATYIDGAVYIQQNASNNWYKTTDAINWTLAGRGPGAATSSLGKLNGTWICALSTDGIYTSSDFVLWTKRNNISGTYGNPSTYSNSTVNLLTTTDALGVMTSSPTVQGLFV